LFHDLVINQDISMPELAAMEKKNG